MHSSFSKTIFPAKVKGILKAPASKSVVQRVLACSLLANGTSVLYNYTPCNDALAAIDIIQKMGAEVYLEGDTLRVISSGIPSVPKKHLEINCGESGLSSRLFAPLCVLFASETKLNGEGSLTKRPFAKLMQTVFDQLNIQYSDNNGYLPLCLKGEPVSGKIMMDGSGGSQFLTGLLMMLPLLGKDSTIEISDLKSKPYIDLTLEIAEDFGVRVSHDDYKIFHIKGKQSFISREFSIEGDWSGASCMLVAGAVAGEIEMTNLCMNTKQSDVRMIDALLNCGAEVLIKDTSVTIRRKELNAFTFDAVDCPDLFPALVSLAANCKGTSRINGVGRLATKESDRGKTLQEEYAKLGVTISFEGDEMLVTGSKIQGAKVFAHNDHRIAMSLAIAALNADSEILIEGAECVNKSYPAFWDDLNKLI